jgi:hypothetical protein
MMLDGLKYLANAARDRVYRQAPAEALHPEQPMWVKAMHLGHGDVVVLRGEAEGMTPWAKELNARTGAMVLILGEGAELEGALRAGAIQRWQESR